MPQYLSLGSLPRKRHIAHRVEPGYRNEGLYYEEVVSTQGFSRAHSIVYHLRPPTRVKHIEPAGGAALTSLARRAGRPTLARRWLRDKRAVRGDPGPCRAGISGRRRTVGSFLTLARQRPAGPTFGRQ